MSNGTFTGRDDELGRLETMWNTEGLVTCCVWGRRRIGKSRLLEEFSKGRRTLYLQAVQGSYYENLSSLAIDVSEFKGKDVGEIKDLSHLMAAVEKICSEEHTLVVIDELPYLLESAPQAASVIQKALDRGFGKCDCMFVVCGSSVSTMRRETEGYDRPLYGRFTNSMRVSFVEPWESTAFHPGMKPLDALKWYMTVGGVPQYLEAAKTGTYESNLEELLLRPDSPWRDDAPQVILQEFRGNRNYTGAVRCIADGHVRQSEIADLLGVDRAACKRVLDDLEFVDIIERVHPMAGAPKKPVYRIKDPFVSFHYKVTAANEKIIQTSKSPEATYEKLRDRIDTHLGHVFEQVCAEWVENHFTVTEIGSWWGRDPDGEDADIDVVAKVIDDSKITYTLACECRFSKNPVGFTVLNTLMRRCEGASITENVRYALFSAGGFQEELREYAEEHDVVLVDCDMLMHRVARTRESQSAATRKLASSRRLSTNEALRTYIFFRFQTLKDVRKGKLSVDHCVPYTKVSGTGMQIPEI